MKTFRQWRKLQEEIGVAPNMKQSNMYQDEGKAHRVMDIATKAARKYPSKMIELLWRVANDKDDRELKGMLEKVDPQHQNARSGSFGMDSKEIDTVVPASPDAGSGDTEGV